MLHVFKELYSDLKFLFSQKEVSAGRTVMQLGLWPHCEKTQIQISSACFGSLEVIKFHPSAKICTRLICGPKMPEWKYVEFNCGIDGNVWVSLKAGFALHKVVQKNQMRLWTCELRIKCPHVCKLYIYNINPTERYGVIVWNKWLFLHMFQ